MHHPTLGLFTQRDPIGYAAGDTNLYRYVGNGSVNSTDATGLINEASPRHQTFGWTPRKPENQRLQKKFEQQTSDPSYMLPGKWDDGNAVWKASGKEVMEAANIAQKVGKLPYDQVSPFSDAAIAQVTTIVPSKTITFGPWPLPIGGLLSLEISATLSATAQRITAANGGNGEIVVGFEFEGRLASATQAQP